MEHKRYLYEGNSSSVYTHIIEYLKFWSVALLFYSTPALVGDMIRVR